MRAEMRARPTRWASGLCDPQLIEYRSILMPWMPGPAVDRDPVGARGPGDGAGGVTSPNPPSYGHSHRRNDDVRTLGLDAGERAKLQIASTTDVMPYLPPGERDRLGRWHPSPNRSELGCGRHRGGRRDTS